jgi:hypothetical protein
MEALKVAIQRSPSKSMTTASAELGISWRSVQRILYSGLHMFPYKITVMHKFVDRDKEQRLYFATWARHEEGILHNTWFSHEAHFHLDGAVNKQNFQFWAMEHLNQFHERDNYGNKITVWDAISSHGITGSFFFDDTVNSTVTLPCHVTILYSSLLQQDCRSIPSGLCKMEPGHT